MQKVTIIDSHTAGEPTRVVVAGGPDVGNGPLDQRRDRFQRHFDRFRSAVVNEPRGSDVIVGALLVEPNDKTRAAGAIFFNNVGCLGMCGHGTIGLIVTLAHMGKIKSGEHRIETPVGVVNPFRVRGIVESFCRYYPEFRREDFEGIQAWRGLRPCSPDGLPYIGRTKNFENLSLAAGHAMMGLSLGPATGKLMAEILSDEKPAVDIAMLSPDRFE